MKNLIVLFAKDVQSIDKKELAKAHFAAVPDCAGFVKVVKCKKKDPKYINIMSYSDLARYLVYLCNENEVKGDS